MWPGNWELDTVRNACIGAFQTLSMSIVGTALGAVMGLLLMPFCSTLLFVSGPLVDEEVRPRWASLAARTTQAIARAIANTFRTVPYFVWAVLFVYMIGLGTFPGALAITLHTGGVFARLFSTALDNVPPEPLAVLRAAGARRWHVLLFGMLPAVRPALVSYTLYRWEVNIRESAVLGLVGAGGIGYWLQFSMGTFDRHAVFTYLLAAMALVLAVDWLSARLRKALI
jgi:phosphonate transport system permease protein